MNAADRAHAELGASALRVAKELGADLVAIVAVQVDESQAGMTQIASTVASRGRLISVHAQPRTETAPFRSVLIGTSEQASIASDRANAARVLRELADVLDDKNTPR